MSCIKELQCIPVTHQIIKLMILPLLVSWLVGVRANMGPKCGSLVAGWADMGPKCGSLVVGWLVFGQTWDPSVGP